MIKAVIFDVGGVLITNEEEYIKADIIATLGITGDQYRDARKELLGYNTGEIPDEKAFWKRFIEFTKSVAPIPKASLWSREFAKRYQIQKGVSDIVRSLKRNGIKLAVLSNTIEPHVKITRGKGVYKPFEVVVLSNEVGMRKPDSKIYELTLARLNVKPEHCVFVDDDQENVAAATNLGINGILFQNAGQLKQELKKLAIPVD